MNRLVIIAKKKVTGSKDAKGYENYRNLPGVSPDRAPRVHRGNDQNDKHDQNDTESHMTRLNISTGHILNYPGILRTL